MAKKRKDPEMIDAIGDETDDHEIRIRATPAETAEYVAQMCDELRKLAHSSADYIASMTVELATLASAAKLDRLTMLLDAARREAETAI